MQEPVKPDFPALLARLREKYPTCFPLEKPIPLKIGIHKDLQVRDGMSSQPTRRFFRWYTARSDYRETLTAGAVRVDLDGNPAGEVTEAQAQLALTGRKPKAKPPASSNNPLPLDIPSAEDNIVPGKLEITLKFNELPKPVQVQAGYQFAVDCDGQRVSVTLKPPMWNKLTAAAASYPQWVASMTGKMGPSEGKGFVLLEPAVQVFEKKPKEATLKTILDDLASDGKVVKAAAQKPEAKISHSRFGSTLKLGAK